MTSPPRKLLVIGWDAADWKVINPLLDAGLMPTLSSLVDAGCIGNIATLKPCLSPMLWTSIATGKRADRHGVCGFVEPLPDATGVKLVGSTTRKTKAIWNITTQAGLKTHVIGWYASHPAEPISGVCVSDQFLTPGPYPAAGETAAPGSIHPPSLHEHLSQFRVSPAELGPGDLLPFIPDLSQALPGDPRPGMLATALAACASVHAVATDVLAKQPWDVAFVYYDAIDRVGHEFMPYHPPRLPHIDERDFALYQHVISGMYRFHDMMLETLLQIAGEDTTVVLLSDHGFHSDHLRPTGSASTQEAQAALWHRHYGLLAMRGPGIKKDDRVYGATLLDVTPTLLTILGLPVGADMEGAPLVNAFASPPAVKSVPSWDAEPGEAGQHPPDTRIDAVASAAAVQQLVDLGYLAPSDDDAGQAERAAREIQFNLATVHLHARRPGQAEPILRHLWQRSPDDPRYGVALAYALCELQQFEDAATILRRLVAAGKTNADVEIMLGQCELATGDEEAAFSRLRRLEEMPGAPASLQLALGDLYRRKRLFGQAEASFRRAIALDEDEPQAHYGLALTLIALKQWEPAAEAALAAVGLLHGLAPAHYVLGVALDELGQPDRAVISINVAIGLAPNFPEAHERLAAIHLRQGNVEQAMRHRQLARVGGPT